MALSSSVATTDVTVNGRCGRDALEVSEAYAQDLAGTAKVLKKAASGSQVFLKAIMENNCRTNGYPAMLIIEVRDSDGITKHLAVQRTKVNPGQHVIEAGASWLMTEPGEYQVRVFTVTYPNCLGALTPVTTF
jgi:hypothetical protein